MLPLVGAAINGFFGRKFSRQAVAGVALSFSGAAFAMVLVVASRLLFAAAPHVETLATWIRAGSFQADFAFYLDQLSLVMLLVVTGVASSFTFIPSATCGRKLVSIAFSPT